MAKKTAAKKAKRAAKASTAKSKKTSVRAGKAKAKSATKTVKAAKKPSRAKKTAKKATKRAAKKTKKTVAKKVARKAGKKVAKKVAKKAGKKSAKKTAKAKSATKAVRKPVRKAAAPKSAAARLRARRAKAKAPARKLTKKQLREFRELLLEKRNSLIGDMNGIEAEAFRHNRHDGIGDLSSMPTHPADLGTDNYEQEFTLGLLESERIMLQDINAALARIAEGTFGICEGTGKPIGLPRLTARPWSRYSIEYARMVERGLVRPGERVDDDEWGEE